MPFAEVTGSIIGIGEHLRQANKIARQRFLVPSATRLMRPFARQDGRTGRSADWVRHISALEDNRFGHEIMNVRGMKSTRSFARNDIGAKFVR